MGLPVSNYPSIPTKPADETPVTEPTPVEKVVEPTPTPDGASAPAADAQPDTTPAG